MREKYLFIFLKSVIISILMKILGISPLHAQQQIILDCDTSASRVVVFQPSEKFSKDATVRYLINETDFRDVNFGNVTNLRTNAWTAQGLTHNNRSFFDFPGLKEFEASEVDSALLSLYAYESTVDGGGSSGDNATEFFLVNEEWEEQTITWNNQPTYDVNQKIDLPRDNSGEDITIDVSSFVQEYLSNKGTYHGFAIKMKIESPHRSRNFASSNWEDASKHPKLELFLKPSSVIQKASTQLDDNVMVLNSSNGVILRSPSGACFKFTVEDDGSLTSELIICPE